MLSASAGLLITARLLYPTIFERFDIIALALFALGVLPWATGFISKVSVLGVEAELRQVEKKAEDALALASSSERRSEELFLEAREERRVEKPEIELKKLADTYVQQRKALRPVTIEPRG